MTPTPPVTVLMSVHNGEPHLRAAVESIMNQSFTDWELVAVDDGSTDSSPLLLAELAARDSRIRVVTLARNQGLAQALNRGLELARGEWIARQDADDISLPTRLEQQLAFLTAHPEVGLLGSNCHFIDHAGTRLAMGNQPLDHVAIRWHGLFHNPFYHTSAIFRRLAPDATPIRYAPELRYAQDYELWPRLLAQTRGANLPAPLVEVRRHPQRASVGNYSTQQRVALDQSWKQLHQLAPELNLTREQVAALRELMINRLWLATRDQQRLALLLPRLFTAFAARFPNEPHMATLRTELALQLWGMLPSTALVSGALLPWRLAWFAPASALGWWRRKLLGNRPGHKWI